MTLTLTEIGLIFCRLVVLDHRDKGKIGAIKVPLYEVASGAAGTAVVELKRLLDNPTKVGGEIICCPEILLYLNTMC